MAEVFKIWGTFTLKEDGDIDKRLNQIEDSARDAARGVGQAADSMDDFGSQMSQVSSDIDDSGSAIDDLTDGFDQLGGIAGGAAGIIAGAFIAALVDGVQYSRDLENQLKDVERRTGANTKEMTEYKKSMEDLFKQGFTNDINAIGEAMGLSRVQTNLTGKKLEDFTKKVMFLSERLGTDYGETIKTIDGMVRDYGITHEEAFNIIAKGYDENLNVAGDLLDLFSEYGSILKNIGIDENDMLSILVSAREKGIFSYDQLLAGAQEFNDVLYEMLADEDTAKEYFDQLGIKAGDVKKAFAEGGEAADKMRGQIIHAIDQIQDPILKAKVGAELYGEGWRVTGGKINDVMLNSQYRAVDTKESMDNLIETDTDPLAKEWNSFYNTWKADTLEPIGKALGDSAADFLKWMNDTNKYLEDGFNSMSKKMKGWNKDIEQGFASMVNWTEKKMDEFGQVLWKASQKARDWFFDIIAGLVDDLNNDLDTIAGMVDTVTGAFYDMGGAVTAVIGKIGNIKFPSMPSWIPGFATGVRDFAGGMAMVGEKGPELVYLPPGSNVYTNKETRNMLENAATRDIHNFSTVSTTEGSTYNINMQIKADDIKSIQNLIDLFDAIKTQSLLQSL